MTVTGVGCLRSCGATTLSLGLAMLRKATGPHLLVEADPAGGTLAAALGLEPEPGLVSMAAAARRRSEPSIALEHGQVLPDGAVVLCGPPASDRARSALTLLSDLVGRLGELDGEVFLDCGRLDAGTSNVETFLAADRSILACRPCLPDLHALAAFLESREGSPHRPMLVLVGPGPYPGAEVADALGVEVAAHLPWDPKAAQAMGTTSLNNGPLSRAPLVRALRTLADGLTERLAGAPIEQLSPSVPLRALNRDLPRAEARL
jgi:hypothetical protein